MTSFELAVHPIGPSVAAAFVLYPLDAAARVLQCWRAGFDRLHPAGRVAAWTVPPGSAFSSAVHTACC